MTYQNRRSFRGSDGLGNPRAANDLDRNKNSNTSQHLSDCNNRIIATHIGDVDEVQAWSARLALDADEWLGARRRA